MTLDDRAKPALVASSRDLATRDLAAPDLSGLQRVGARPPLAAYVREVWHRRAFVGELARARLRAEHQQNRLGLAWVVLRPLLDALVYGTVFGVLMASGRPQDYVEFLVIGVFWFAFFNQSVTAGAKAVTTNVGLVQSLSFPRMVLPLAVVVQRAMPFTATVGVCLAIVMGAGHAPSTRWLLLPPLMLLFAAFCTGLTLIAARLTVHLRDIDHLLPFLMRILFYTSGIFYSIDQRFADRPQVRDIADLVPIHAFLSLARGLCLGGPDNPVRAEHWIVAGGWTAVVLAAGIVFFWSAEERYGRVA